MTKEPDGTIDVVRADKAWKTNTLSPKTSKTPSKHDAETKPVSMSAVNRTRAFLQENNIALTSSDSVTYAEAKTANEIIKAQTNELRLKQLKGDLIDRRTACDHVFQLARQERDAWATWPARVASQMAVKLGVDTQTLHGILEEHIREHLLELSDIQPRL